MTLDINTLRPVKGSRRKKVRLGRGEASGVGKTAGRGGKGQKGRAGASIRAGFEGGQIPLYRRLPKLGFFSRKKTTGANRYTPIPTQALESFKAGSTVTSAELIKASLLKKGFKAKLLVRGKLTKKLTVEVDAASQKAIEAVTAVGGSVKLPEKAAPSAA